MMGLVCLVVVWLITMITIGLFRSWFGRRSKSAKRAEGREDV